MPFKRSKHQLIFFDRAAEEHGHLGEARRWCVAHQIGHLPVERAVDDHAQGTLVWLMLRNKKHGAPEIRVQHIRVGNQQRTGETARERLVTKMTHAKLETAMRARATRARMGFCTAGGLRRPGVAIDFLEFIALAPAAVKAGENFQIKFITVKVFHDCSGGNSRPSRPSGVGGGNFLQTKACFFLLVLALAHARALARLQPEQTPNVQCRNQQSQAEFPGRSR